ncbi:MAG: FAD-binding protein, partial [Dongiaceae bacterium]
MGGQQFLSEGVLVDMRGMNRIVALDRQRGLIEVGAGIEWPALIDYLEAAQAGSAEKWTIAQKQTGADRLTLGGALSANAHGRGLARKPIIADVESFTLIDAAGTVRRCSRTDNAELFRLAIGGYGLFGAVASVRLRLAPRRALERVVQVIEIDDLV